MTLSNRGANAETGAAAGAGAEPPAEPPHEKRDSNDAGDAGPSEGAACDTWTGARSGVGAAGARPTVCGAGADTALAARVGGS